MLSKNTPCSELPPVEDGEIELRAVLDGRCVCSEVMDGEHFEANERVGRVDREAHERRTTEEHAAETG